MMEALWEVGRPVAKPLTQVWLSTVNRVFAAKRQESVGVSREAEFVSCWPVDGVKSFRQVFEVGQQFLRHLDGRETRADDGATAFVKVTHDVFSLNVDWHRRESVNSTGNGQ